jgi:hypothetical protein
MVSAAEGRALFRSASHSATFFTHVCQTISHLANTPAHLRHGWLYSSWLYLSIIQGKRRGTYRDRGSVKLLAILEVRDACSSLAARYFLKCPQFCSKEASIELNRCSREILQDAVAPTAPPMSISYFPRSPHTLYLLPHLRHPCCSTQRAFCQGRLWKSSVRFPRCRRRDKGLGPSVNSYRYALVGSLLLSPSITQRLGRMSIAWPWHRLSASSTCSSARMATSDTHLPLLGSWPQ